MAWLANRSERWVEGAVPEPDTVCISITEPGHVARVPAGYRALIRLEFDDLTPKSARHWGQLWGTPPTLCSPADARRIVRFARRHRGRNIVVHCAAGVSRSGAVAEVLLRAFPEYDDRGDERWPNPYVKALLLEALGPVESGLDIRPSL